MRKFVIFSLLFQLL